MVRYTKTKRKVVSLTKVPETRVSGPERGLIAAMERNMKRREKAKGKGPRARVAKMVIDQRHNSCLDPIVGQDARRIIKPL